MEEDDGSTSKGWPVFLWRKNTPGFWKRDQQDTEVIPLKECHRSYPRVGKCQQVALFHVTLGDIWRGSVENVEETFVVGQTATFKSGFLGWSSRSGHPAHLVESARGLKNQASAAESEDGSFYAPDLLKVKVSAESVEGMKMSAGRWIWCLKIMLGK